MIREILAISKPLGGKAIMLIKSKKENKRRPRKLAFEMLEDLGISVLISLFIFCFFYFTAVSISENYLYMRGFILAEGHQRALAMWITGICVIAAVVAFLVLFLFMTGRRLSYLIDIINSIEKMEDAEEKFYITPEGNDELTKLAESINYLSESQNDIIRKEKEMKEKRELFIRSLSHDIRTPLTSIIAYSDFMIDKKELSESEMRKYIELIQVKSEQMKVLTDRLLEEKNESGEYISSMKLLAEQLADEWKDTIEDRFDCTVEVDGSYDFGGMVDVYDFRRIIDNLASNVEKYASTSGKVEMYITLEKDNDKNIFHIRQKNKTAKITPGSAESYGIGINSIKKIAEFYKGRTEVIGGEDNCAIDIILFI